MILTINSEITQFLGRLCASWEDFIVVFWSLLTCAKWCFCPRLSRGMIFTAYLLGLEISPIGKAKKLSPDLDISLLEQTHALGSKHKWAVLGVTWKPCCPMGCGGVMARGWTVLGGRGTLLGTRRPAAPAVLGVIASTHTHSCNIMTAGIQLFPLNVHFNSLTCPEWKATTETAHFLPVFFFFSFYSQFYLCSAFMFLF